MDEPREFKGDKVLAADNKPVDRDGSRLLLRALHLVLQDRAPGLRLLPLVQQQRADPLAALRIHRQGGAREGDADDQSAHNREERPRAALLRTHCPTQTFLKLMAESGEELD